MQCNATKTQDIFVGILSDQKLIILTNSFFNSFPQDIVCLFVYLLKLVRPLPFIFWEMKTHDHILAKEWSQIEDYWPTEYQKVKVRNKY